LLATEDFKKFPTSGELPTTTTPLLKSVCLALASKRAWISWFKRVMIVGAF
jgi:hypothetical protein